MVFMHVAIYNGSHSEYSEWEQLGKLNRLWGVNIRQKNIYGETLFMGGQNSLRHWIIWNKSCVLSHYTGFSTGYYSMLALHHAHIGADGMDWDSYTFIWPIYNYTFSAPFYGDWGRGSLEGGEGRREKGGGRVREEESAWERERKRMEGRGSVPILLSLTREVMCGLL